LYDFLADNTLAINDLNNFLNLLASFLFKTKLFNALYYLANLAYYLANNLEAFLKKALN